VIADLDRKLTELRFLQGIEKVEHVPYQTGDQFWVRFNKPIDLGKLDQIVKKHGYVMTKFASVPSRLPRGLGELFWDGVTHVIARSMSGWSRFTSKFGFEPEGIAKLATDLHGPNQIFIATDEEGIQLLYEYLGLEYLPPAPSSPVVRLSQPTAQKSVSPPKPQVSLPTNVEPAPSRTLPSAARRFASSMKASLVECCCRRLPSVPQLGSRSTSGLLQVFYLRL